MADHSHDHDHHDHDHHEHDDGQRLGEGAQALMNTLRLGFSVLGFLLVAMVLYYVLSGFKSLDQNQRGYIKRFGKIVGIGDEAVKESGRLHFAFPKPVDQFVVVSATEVRSIETGSTFWFKEKDPNMMTPSDSHEQEEEGPPGQGLNIANDGYLITADSNIIHMKWRMTYTLDDIIAYDINYDDINKALQITFENAIIKEVSSTTIDVALYSLPDAEGRLPLNSRVKIRLQKTLRDISDNGKSAFGVDIDNINVEIVARQPAKSTMQAFTRVSNADMEASTKRSEALSYQKKVIGAAKGEADRIVADAEAYANQYKANVEADSLALTEVARNYEIYGTSFLIIKYVDTIEAITRQSKERYVLYPGQQIRTTIGKVPRNPNSPGDAKR